MKKLQEEQKKGLQKLYDKRKKIKHTNQLNKCLQ
jgi:hypothetical protein